MNNLNSPYGIRAAQPEDSAALVHLVESTPQKGAISLSFERSPCFFHGTGVCTQYPDVWVYEDQNTKKIPCVYSIGQRDVYLNGRVERIRYGNDLRISNEFQNSRALYRLFKQYKASIGDQGWMQTVILEDNKTSLQTVGSGRANLPTYFPYGTIHTHMVYLDQKSHHHDHSFVIRRAEIADVDKMQCFFDREAASKHFYPYYRFNELVSGNPYYLNLDISHYYLAFEHGTLVGICGIWDQDHFKRTRVKGYNFSMHMLRLCNNSYSALFGGLKLPRIGRTLNYIYTHSLVTQNNRCDIFSALFSCIHGQINKAKTDALLVGLSASDELNEVLSPYRKRLLVSKQFLAAYGSDPRKELDERHFYPEIARL